MTLPEDFAEKPKKKRGRPKGSKNKQKEPEVKEKAEEPQFETKLGETLAPKKDKPASESELTVAKSAEEEAEKESEAITAVVKAVESFTNKRGQEVIFRREMGEPEFFRYKKDLKPQRPILSQDEEEEISRKVQIPTDQTPQYKPEHVLSPEFLGISNYERGVEEYRQELEEKLHKLKSNPNSTTQEIEKAEEDLKALDYLYENYYGGMSVFRTAKGGRAKLHK